MIKVEGNVIGCGREADGKQTITIKLTEESTIVLIGGESAELIIE